MGEARQRNPVHGATAHSLAVAGTASIGCHDEMPSADEAAMPATGVTYRSVLKVLDTRENRNTVEASLY